MSNLQSRGDLTLQLEDIEPLAIVPMPISNGKLINAQFKKRKKNGIIYKKEILSVFDTPETIPNQFLKLFGYKEELSAKASPHFDNGLRSFFHLGRSFS